MRLVVATLVLAALPAAFAFADDVHLANGRVYEDVLAEEIAGGVRIRLPFGTMTLPASQVVRIERAPAALGEYLARTAALEASADATAADWVALARWARANGLPHGVRQAALLAAELDPSHAGLPPLLVPAGYRLDEELGRWLPLEEAMARRGFVPFDGTWITREERDALRAAEETRRAEAVARRAAEQLERAAAEIAAENRRREEERLRERSLVWGGWGVPVLAIPVYLPPPLVVHPPLQPPPTPDPGATPSDRGYRRLVDRQPGSFIPVGRSGAHLRVGASSDR